MTHTLANKQAVYFFNIEGGQACVSKIVRKGQKGTDKYARCSIAMARHWYKELLDEGAQPAPQYSSTKWSV